MSNISGGWRKKSIAPAGLQAPKNGHLPRKPLLGRGLMVHYFLRARHNALDGWQTHLRHLGQQEVTQPTQARLRAMRLGPH